MNKTLKGMIACLALAAALLAVPCVAQAGQGKGISIRENFGKDLRRVLKREKYDQNRDGFLSRGEIRKIKSIGVYPDYISDTANVRGISRLKNLEKLKIKHESHYGKKVYGFKEIGKLKKLKAFRMNMGLKEKRKIDLSKLKHLSYVNIDSSKLTVSVGKGNGIRTLYLTGVENGASLVQKCRKVRKATIMYSNRKTSIRLEGMKYLRSLEMERCSNVDSIRIMDCKKLQVLGFDTIRDCGELEVKNCGSLWTSDVYFGTIGKIVMENIPQIEELAVCRVKKLKEASLSDMKTLKEMRIEGNPKLGKLTLENLPKLKEANFNHNAISELNIIGENSLTSLYLYNNRLRTFMYENLHRLYRLRIGKNQLEGILDLSPYPNLGSLSCENNRLTEIYGGTIGGEFGVIYCSNNRLKLIDFRNSKAAILELDCRNNPGVVAYGKIEDCSHDPDAKIYYCYD